MTTALILFLIILLCSLLLADFSWSNVLSTDRNEVVFAGRNHEYGAYRITTSPTDSTRLLSTRRIRENQRAV